MEQELKQRIERKRESVYNLKNKIDSLKRKIRKDIISCNEKDRITALVIRMMINTSERVGNGSSASNGHFGITHFKKKHVSVSGNTISLNYKGKSGVDHQKEYCDEVSATILKPMLRRCSNDDFLFTTKDGFHIKPDRVNRYLKQFDAKSKDIRGFNANRMMVIALNRIGKVKEEKQRPKIFNEQLRKVAEKIGHGPATLRKHYLLPEIEQHFYKTGSVGRIKID